jgi:hypothetical protein
MEGISFASGTQEGTSKSASQVAGLRFACPDQGGEPGTSGLGARPHLVERLAEGLRPGPKLTPISAPAGFGKTTLLSKWVAGCTGEMGVA